jgi:hypothetical protein
MDVETDPVHGGDRRSGGGDPLANQVAHLEFDGRISAVGRWLEWVGGSRHRILTAT